MEAQVSDTSEDGMTWSCVSTGPYMEMLNMASYLIRLSLLGLNRMLADVRPSPEARGRYLRVRFSYR